MQHRMPGCPLDYGFYDKTTCTAKPGKLYIHLFVWSDNEELLLGEVKAEINRIYFLAEVHPGSRRCYRKLKFIKVGGSIH